MDVFFYSFRQFLSRWSVLLHMSSWRGQFLKHENNEETMKCFVSCKTTNHRTDDAICEWKKMNMKYVWICVRRLQFVWRTRRLGLSIEGIVCMRWASISHSQRFTRNICSLSHEMYFDQLCLYKSGRILIQIIQSHFLPIEVDCNWFMANNDLRNCHQWDMESMPLKSNRSNVYWNISVFLSHLLDTCFLLKIRWTACDDWISWTKTMEFFFVIDTHYTVRKSCAKLCWSTIMAFIVRYILQ